MEREAMLIGLVLLAAYLIGSFPSALLITKLLTGQDIRAQGDGNMGAKNTFQTVGRAAGLAVGAMDIAKGALAVEAARQAQVSEIWVLAAGTCAALGHDFPVFAGLRGGQGMAAILGVLGALFPLETILGLCVFGVSLALTRRWDASCAAGFVTFVALVWIFDQPPHYRQYPFILLPTIAASKMIHAWQARQAMPH